ncbi:hypothetical protein EXIGLDRAFT_506116 [Exidia glandulosa HHB12029]|uniref:Uncharacterized protein n=1 Tax=Exidia glandulosa HHB12029 TaxID=1314781 RepID=A0A165JBK1_EXIGL|nr:hypothetical protein EXIGLDRAFT_506116 [Exidia glandulosa HHB12029]
MTQKRGRRRGVHVYAWDAKFEGVGGTRSGGTSGTMAGKGGMNCREVANREDDREEDAYSGISIIEPSIDGLGSSARARVEERERGSNEMTENVCESNMLRWTRERGQIIAVCVGNVCERLCGESCLRSRRTPRKVRNPGRYKTAQNSRIAIVTRMSVGMQLEGVE